MDNDDLKNNELSGMIESTEYSPDMITDSKGTSRHRGFCIAPIIKMELKNKLKDKYGDDDNSYAEYNHPNVDWNYIYRQVVDGCVMFDPNDLPPQDFVELMQELKAGYIIECLNWLSLMDDDTLQQNLHDMPSSLLKSVRNEAYNNQSFACQDFDEYRFGENSLEDDKKAINSRHGVLLDLERIISGILIERIKRKRSHQSDKEIEW